MDAKYWLGFSSVVCCLMTAACSSGGGANGGTGVASGTACVRVNDGDEVCVSSGVTATRDLTDGTVHMSVAHWSNIDCFSRPANEFVLNLSIPDGLPFPYQANKRPGNANFGTGTCAWDQSAFEGDLVSGIIYHAGTNGSATLEGDVTASYVSGSAADVCSTTCTGATCNCPATASVSAQFRFNVPL
jgi:hypothetical protein